MTYIFVDIEADGPCPGIYSMTELGAVAVDGVEIGPTFYTNLKPIEGAVWDESVLHSIGKTRDETLDATPAGLAMIKFTGWVNQFEKPMFISDNNGFDWQFVNYYFMRYIGSNPFGHSSTNLGSLYKGMEKSMFVSFKYLRKTAHTHNPVDDAMGNAEAFIAMIERGLKVGR
jgi:DNA polymerase III, epsilon subunit and related 3''-5'' exonucleases